MHNICQNCKNWEKSLEKDYGICDRLNQDPLVKPNLDSYDFDAVSLFTRKDFGCIKFEKGKFIVK